MVKLFRGWELVNNAARSSLYDAQNALLLLMSFVCRKLLLHQFSKFWALSVPERLNAKLATLTAGGCLTRIIAVMIAMINHISYGLNLPNTVSITWCMSSLGLEEGC